ncbi:MAG: glutathione S-transferase family protein [Novosphingobium sp.]|nr:glutathione S-transferase family protein [Novosphingobium sp.]
MKIWGTRDQGNPVRVAIFVEEKGIDIPFEPVDLLNGEHKQPAFLAKNPAAQIPVLELDDGTCISETVAICRYLERLFPEPALMGRTPLEEATIEMWQRRVEFGFFDAARAVFRHSVPFVKALEPVQLSEWADLNRPRIVTGLEMLEPQLANHPFVAGPDFSIADITAVLPLRMLDMLGIELPDHCPAVARWREDVLARPSVAKVLTPPQTAS